jgi:hypothetical protein
VWSSSGNYNYIDETITLFRTLFVFSCCTSEVAVKLSLCLTNYALRHEDVLGVDAYVNILFTSTLVGGEWSASRKGRFTPGGKSPSYPQA